MRLQESRKQSVTLRPRSGGDDVPVWGAGVSIRAVIQPLNTLHDYDKGEEKEEHVSPMAFFGVEQ